MLLFLLFENQIQYVKDDDLFHRTLDPILVGLKGQKEIEKNEKETERES